MHNITRIGFELLQQKTGRTEAIAAGRGHVRRTRVDSAQQGHTRFTESHAQTRADATDGLCSVPTEQRSRQLLFAAAEHP